MVNYDSLEVFFEIMYSSTSQSNVIYDMERITKCQNIILEIYKNFVHTNLKIIEKALEITAPL